MLKVALTGGIAAGKSTALQRFRQLGAAITDADLLAREVVAPGSAGLAEVVQRFGPEVLLANGSLDRAGLGQKVFDDAAARLSLEKILHPLVQSRAAAAANAAEKAGQAVLVQDIPLLAETGGAGLFDQVVVVQAPLEVRRQRAISQRGYTAEQFDARVAAQATNEERAAIASHILDGSGSTAELWSQVDQLFARWTAGRAPAP